MHSLECHKKALLWRQNICASQSEAGVTEKAGKEGRDPEVKQKSEQNSVVEPDGEELRRELNWKSGVTETGPVTESQSIRHFVDQRGSRPRDAAKI